MRCFVALFPPPETASALDRIAAALHAEAPGSRRIAPENLHLTLAFIGEMPASRSEAVRRALSAIDVAPFDWDLDRIGAFSRSGISWAGGPASLPLQTLAEKVRGSLDALGIDYDRKPFVAHVTVLRRAHARLRAQPIDGVTWRIDRPVLAVSRPNENTQQYERLA